MKIDICADSEEIAQKINELSPYYKPHELKWFTIIGWYQILGGIVGIGVLGWLLIQNLSLPAILMIALGMGVYGCSIFAGRQLQKRQHVQPTYLIQAVQILNFVGLGVTFQLVSGLAIGFGFEWIEEAKVVLNVKLLSLFEFKYNPDQTEAIQMIVNFVPIGIINYLAKRKEAATTRKRLAEYSSARV